MNSSFWLLWTAQFLSILGTDITRFALRVWTFEQTQSVAHFALITFFAEIPAFLVSPIAGVLTDRYSKRNLLLSSDAIAASASILLCFSTHLRILRPGHIYFANAIQSVANSIQFPAFLASVTLLVPKNQLSKAAGFTEGANALSMLVAPAISGILLEKFGLEGILALEIVTFIIGFSSTLFTRIPSISASREEKFSEGNARQNVFKEAAEAMVFIKKDSRLRLLIAFQMLGQFSSGMVQVLVTPLVLSFASANVLGNVLSLSGTGALFGSALVGIVGSNSPYRTMMVCNLIQGILLAFCGLKPDARIILAVAFSYMALIPLVRSSRTIIWQNSTPMHMQGRIFSFQGMIRQLSLPLAAIISGPLTDSFFEILLSGKTENILSRLVGPVLGVGPGRGIAFLFVVLGTTNVLAAVSALSLGSDAGNPDSHHKL